MVGAAVAAVVAAAVAVVATDDGDDETSTPTTTEVLPQETSTTTTAVPDGGNEDFAFPTRPIEDDDAFLLAGARGFGAFAGVDPAFFSRVRAVEPGITNVGIVAETYDAAISLLLAALVSGEDGSAVAGSLPDVTRIGTTCTVVTECVAAGAAGQDIDYDGVTGRIELGDNGDRTTSRWQVTEVNRTAALRPLPPEEVDASALIAVGARSVPVPTTRASDGVLRIGALAADPRGTLVPRLRGAAQVAMVDVAAAGGVGVPVELLPAVDAGIFPEDELAAADALIAGGVDAVLVVGPEPATVDALTEAGVLVLQTIPTDPDHVLTEPGDDGFDEAGLRFGFGPSLVAEAVYLGQLLELDGCRDVVLVTTDDDELGRSTAALGEVFGITLANAGIGTTDVAIPLLGGDAVEPAQLDASVEEVAAALEEERCAVLATGDLDGSVAPLVAGLAEAGVGPHDRFLYLADPLLGQDLVDVARQLEQGD